MRASWQPCRRLRVCRCQTPRGWSSHAQLLAAQMRRGAADGVAGYRYDNRGFVAGADRFFGDYQLGAAMSYQNCASSTMPAIPAAIRMGYLQFCAVSCATSGGICGACSATAPVGWIRAVTSGWPIWARQATSHSQADMLLAGLEGGFDVPLGPVTLTPFVGLDYATCFWGGFGEHDAGALSVKIDDATAESLRSSLGMVFAAPLEFGSAFYAGYSAKAGLESRIRRCFLCLPGADGRRKFQGAWPGTGT